MEEVDIMSLPIVFGSGELKGQNIINLDGKKEFVIDPSQLIIPEIEPTEVQNLDDNLSEYIDTQFQVYVTYNCRLCAFKSPVRQNVAKHVEKFHLSKEDDNVKKGRLAYMCGNCSEAFATFRNCRMHMANVHNINLDTNIALEGADLQDGIDYISRENGNINIISKSDTIETKSRYKCPIFGCFTMLRTQDNVEKHRQCHVGDSAKCFACPQCGENFKIWPLCLNHIWKEHQIDMGVYSCSSCEYKSPCRQKIRQHEKIHKDCKDFVCSVCLKTFKQKTQLRNHQVYHLKSTSDAPNWVKKRECEICKNTFSDAKSLKKHVQAVHSKLRPYVCQVCGYSSATKYMLTLHLRQHSGEKPYVCNTCPFTTGDHNSLRRHMMRHLGTTQYKCPHCPYSSIQSSSFKSHLSKRHPDIPGVLFSCTKCPFMSISAKVFDLHRHDEKIEEPEELGLNVATAQNELIATSFPSLMTEDSESNIFEDAVDFGGITIPASPNLITLDN